MVFSVSSTWSFFAFWVANFTSSSISRDSVFSVGRGLSEWERSISSKGNGLGEEGNSGGVTANGSLDKTEVVRALSGRKRVICRNPRFV